MSEKFETVIAIQVQSHPTTKPNTQEERAEEDYFSLYVYGFGSVPFDNVRSPTHNKKAERTTTTT